MYLKQSDILYMIWLSSTAPPMFTTSPKSKSVGVGRRASFECQVVGNPIPAIFWKRHNSAVSDYVFIKYVVQYNDHTILSDFALHFQIVTIYFTN